MYLGDDRPVHAPEAGGRGYTLCGDALEDDPSIGHAAPRVARVGEVITCARCTAVITHARDSFGHRRGVFFRKGPS